MLFFVDICIYLIEDLNYMDFVLGIFLVYLLFILKYIILLKMF